MLKRLTRYITCLCFMVVGVAVVTGCSKDDDFAVRPEPEKDLTALIKDSIYYYYKKYSLWADKNIPGEDEAQDLIANYADYSSLLEALKSKTPRNSNTGEALDRYSYITEVGDSSAEEALYDDENYGYGLFFQLGTINDSIAYPFIYFVEGGSPAEQAGIIRSDQVIGVNDNDDLAITVSCTQSCAIVDDEQYNRVLNIIDDALQQASLKITVKKGNDINTYQLPKERYKINPIQQAKVLSYPESRIGYLSFSSFVSLEEQPDLESKINRVFSDFQQAGIDNLVVDLRYNGGGYMNTAIFLANKIAPERADKQVMLQYDTNQYLRDSPEHWPEEISFKPVYFKRDNQLQLHTVYFIVTRETASAAEALINVLRPYMEVKIIADGEATYGKPVGFFEQVIENKVSLWVTSFQIKNAENDGDYWNGIPADWPQTTDYIFKDLGDPGESMLKIALEDARKVVSRDANAVQTGRLLKKINLISPCISLMP